MPSDQPRQSQSSPPHDPGSRSHPYQRAGSSSSRGRSSKPPETAVRPHPNVQQYRIPPAATFAATLLPPLVSQVSQFRPIAPQPVMSQDVVAQVISQFSPTAPQPVMSQDVGTQGGSQLRPIAPRPVLSQEVGTQAEEFEVGGTKLFMITLSQCDLDRDTIFEKLDDVVRRMVIGLEQHVTTVGRHFHVVVEMRKDIRARDLRKLVSQKLWEGEEGHSLNIQIIRSEKVFREKVTYSTKFDHDPIIKAVPTSYISDFCQTYNILEKSGAVEVDDPYLFDKHIMHYFWLEKLNTKICNEKFYASEDVRVKQLREDFEVKYNVLRNGNWLDQVISWCETARAALTDGSWRNDYRKKNLYLHGGTRNGKTTCLDMYFPELVRSYKPTSEELFGFSGLNEKHSAIYLPDCDRDFHTGSKRQVVLRLCEGGAISVAVKFGDPRLIAWDRPFVCASNFPPPETGNDPEVDAIFLSRFTVISTEGKRWRECCEQRKDPA